MTGGRPVDPLPRPPDEPLAAVEEWETELWLLATNLPDLHQGLACYRRRMWIEGMFADLEGYGFDLESTQLRRFGKLSRLTLAVAILYVWLTENGAQAL